MFHHAHKECTEAHQGGTAEITDALNRALLVDATPVDVPSAIAKIAEQSYIAASERRTLLVHAWSQALDRYLAEGLLDEHKENRLVEFMKTFNLTKEDLGTSFEGLVKSAVLRDVMNGIISKRFSVENLPFNLQKSEQVVWVFLKVQYLEDRTHRVYVGGSHGLSIRIAKGVYYRTSSFKGQPIDTTERQHMDSGMSAITNKNLYFNGAQKAMRIPLTKVVAFHPYADGVGVMRDAASAKPQTFITGDGWFTYNLVSNLAKL